LLWIFEWNEMEWNYGGGGGGDDDDEEEEDGTLHLILR
jgi:hypothetical protein